MGGSEAPSQGYALREIANSRRLAVVRLAIAVVVLHGLEIQPVGGFLAPALLAVVGQGDLLLSRQLFNALLHRRSPPSRWRTLAPIESVMDVLMCGISVSLLFAIVTRLINREEGSSPNKQGAGVTHRSFAQRNISCKKAEK